jgi:hypothetical protein
MFSEARTLAASSKAFDEETFSFGVRILAADALTAFEPRKTPIQARATLTVEAISEATIQILLSQGAERGHLVLLCRSYMAAATAERV